MKAYCYDKNGLFAGVVDADESPLEPGVYLFPARSVKIAPPSFLPTQIPVWTDTGWVIKERNLLKKSASDPDTVDQKIATARQIRLALLDLELLDDVEALVADEKTPRNVKIEWEYANEFDPNNPLITSFATSLNKSEAEVAALFDLARTK